MFVEVISNHDCFMNPSVSFSMGQIVVCILQGR